MYTGQWRLSPLQGRHLGPHTVLPVAIRCPVVFPKSSSMVWNLFPFKGDFSFGKSRKLVAGCQIWAVGGLSHPSDLMFHQSPCPKRDAWVGTLLWWSCQSPVAQSCSLLNHPNSFHRGMFKLKAKLDADSLLYLLSHFECDRHTVLMLTQWHLPLPLTSTVKSSLFTHAHSLAARLRWCWTNHSHYINNGWTFSGQISSYIWSS